MHLASLFASPASSCSCCEMCHNTIKCESQQHSGPQEKQTHKMLAHMLLPRHPPSDQLLSCIKKSKFQCIFQQFSHSSCHAMHMQHFSTSTLQRFTPLPFHTLHWPDSCTYAMLRISEPRFTSPNPTWANKKYATRFSANLIKWHAENCQNSHAYRYMSKRVS